MPRFAANLTMLYTELPFLDRFAAAAKTGFKAVEFLFPYDFEAETIAARLREHRLLLVLHNLPAGDWAAAPAWSVPWPTPGCSARHASTAWPAYARRA